MGEKKSVAFVVSLFLSILIFFFGVLGTWGTSVSGDQMMYLSFLKKLGKNHKRIIKQMKNHWRRENEVSIIVRNCQVTSVD